MAPPEVFALLLKKVSAVPVSVPAFEMAPPVAAVLEADPFSRVTPVTPKEIPGLTTNN
jgi:hypothetical protein